jgi:hypothetical protein
LLAALRADFPTADDEARVRRKLVAMGAAVGTGAALGSALAAGAVGQAATGSTVAALVKPALSGAIGGTSTVVAGAKSGAILAAWSGLAMTTKVVVAAGTFAVGAAYPVVRYVDQLEAVPDQRELPTVSGTSESGTSESGTSESGTSETAARQRTAAPQTSQKVGTDSGQRLAATEPPHPAREVPPVGQEASQTRSASVEPGHSGQYPRPEHLPPLAGGANASASRVPIRRRDSREPRATSLTAGSAAETGVASAPAAAQWEPSHLREETALIESALRATQHQDATEARRSLDEHARRFPNGLLARERDRLRAALP